MWTSLASLAIKGFSLLIGIFQKREIRQEVLNEAAAKENTDLAQDIAIGDHVDNLPDIDKLRASLNERP